MTDNLIHRLEAAEGPSRELDCRIWVAIHGKGQPLKTIGEPVFKNTRYFCNPNPEIEWFGYDLLNFVDCYTASLDAAMSLVPEGWRLHGLEEAALEGWRCRLSRRNDGLIVGVNNHEGQTAALALCIAALVAHRKERSP